MLRTHILKTVEAKRQIIVGDLFRIIEKDNPGLSEEVLVQEVKELQSRGMVTLEDTPPVERSFMSFLCKWELNVDFYLLVALTLAAGCCLYLIPHQYPYALAQWTIGLIFVFLAPGYATTTAISFRNFSTMETLLMSVGLSVVLVMFLGLMLSLSPWGINIGSSALGLFGYTVFLGFIGRWKQYQPRPQRTRH
jgi:hypothetical protein